HIFNDYLQRNSSYYGLQGSMTSQVTPHHQLKFGGDFQRHTLRFFEHYAPDKLGGKKPNLIDWDGYGYDLRVVRDTSRMVRRVDLVETKSGRDGLKHPKTWSMFVQDKFEREGVIVNGGLRFDYINVDTPALRNDFAPLENGPYPDSLDTQDLAENRTYAR